MKAPWIDKRSTLIEKQLAERYFNIRKSNLLYQLVMDQDGSVLRHIPDQDYSARKGNKKYARLKLGNWKLPPISSL